MGIVYCAINMLNGNLYIGKTVGTLKRRKYRHHSDSKVHRYNSRLHDAIRKYSKEIFKWMILYEGDDFDQKEIDFIHLYDTVNSGYNIIETLQNSEYIRERMRLAWTPKRRKLQSERCKKEGYMRTPEAREKLKNSLKEYYSIHPAMFKGQKHSEKSLQNMSETHLKNWTLEKRNRHSDRQKGLNNPAIKQYNLISPDNIQYSIKGREFLKLFCISKSLPYFLLVRKINDGIINFKKKSSLNGWRIDKN